MSQENTNDEVIGAIFPIKSKHVSPLFELNKNIFLKFTNMTLENNSTIVLYVSGEKIFVGEAKIKQIRRMNPNAAWSSYKDRIFLDEKEYAEYAFISPISKDKRKMKEITLLELDKVRRYKKPVKSVFYVSPAGRYLTKEMAEKIRKSRE